MSLNLTQLRRLVAFPMDLDVNDATILSDIDLALNRSFWEILNKFKFRLEEILINWQTIAGERNYNVPDPLEALSGVYFEDPDSKEHRPLGQITAEVYEKRYVNDADFEDQPTHYVREFCLIKLWPTPDAVYDMVMRRRIILSDIGTANTTFQVPQEWHDPILFGGQYRMFIQYNDLNRANVLRAHQTALINTLLEMQEKEEIANTSLSGLEVAWDEYGSYQGADGGRLDWR